MKTEINKIDYELKNLFENVSINELTNKNRFYIQIIAENNNIKVKLNIDKDQLDKSLIKWEYYPNPNENLIIERISNIDTLSFDIFDIFKSKRLDKTYIKENFKEKELIKEDFKFDEDDLSLSIKEELETLTGNSMFILDKTRKYFILESDSIKMSDRFVIESKLNNKISFVSFSDKNESTFIKITF